MAPRYTRYEYETSPHKIEPDFIPSRTPKKKPTSSPNKKNNTKTSDKEVKKQIVKKAKEQVKARKEKQIRQKKMVLGILFAFGVLLVISYRNSLINENFTKVKELKEELAIVEKENEQLQVSIESNLNLTNLEQSAKDKLGMQRLDNSQKIYVALPKKDYVEPAPEQIQINENENWIQKIWNKILGK